MTHMRDLPSYILTSPPSRQAAALDHARLEGEYMAIIQSSDDAIISKNVDGLIQSWNPAATQLFGWEAEEVIGQSIRLLIPPDRQAEEDYILSEIVAGRRVAHFETVRQHKSGTCVHVSITASPIRDAEGRVVGASKIARDISLRLQRDQALWAHSHLDALTGLHNRLGLIERLSAELRLEALGPTGLSLLVMDLNQFKALNLRHPEAGDQLLQAIAQRLAQNCGPQDILARTGGDEFAAVLRHHRTPDATDRAVQQLRHALDQPYDLPCGQHHIRLSYGFADLAELPLGAAASDLVNAAMRALQRAQRARPNTDGPRLITPTDLTRLRRLERIQDALSGVVQRQELQLLYQPLVDLDTGQSCRMEALLRWQHPTLGPISPADFIPLAEQSEDIIEIGNWVFAQVLRDLAHMPADKRVSFNVSPVQLHHPSQPCAQWAAQVAASGIAPPRLLVEVTEAAHQLFTNAEQNLLRSWRTMGMRIAVDDFGTGWSCLSSLHQLEVDVLKLDRSFVFDIARNPRNQVLCKAIIEMGHGLGMRVTAEGVEQPEQLAMLCQLGCNVAQGWLFSKAQPLHDALAWAAEHNRALGMPDTTIALPC